MSSFPSCPSSVRFTLTLTLTPTHPPVVLLGRVVEVLVRVQPRPRPPGRIHPQVPQPAHLIGGLIVTTVHHQTGEGREEEGRVMRPAEGEGAVPTVNIVS